MTVTVSTTVPIVSGDLNCDNVLNTSDIAPFILALTDPAAYTASYPACNPLRGDMNGDSVVDGLDVQAFSSALVNQ